MLNENRFLDTFRGHNIRPISFLNFLLWVRDGCHFVFVRVVLPLSNLSIRHKNRVSASIRQYDSFLSSW